MKETIIINFRKILRRVFSSASLTKKHNALTRYGFGAIAFIATIAITSEPKLARDAFRQLKSDNFITGFRRFSWYMRRGWPKLNFSADPLFPFCEYMEREELTAIRRFLMCRKAHQSHINFQAELCFISACSAVEAFGKPYFLTEAQTFFKDAQIALESSLKRRTVGKNVKMKSKVTALGSNEFSRMAEQALYDTVKLLHSKGFDPFVLSGTLLGAVREGGILKHDYDIDLGLFADEININNLENLLCNSPPFRCIYAAHQVVFSRSETGTLINTEIPVIFKLRHETGVVADIFLHHREGDSIWHGSSLFRWTNSSFGLKQFELAGTKVLGPDNPAVHLTENYGDWRTPKTDFNCAVDTPNLELFLNPSVIALSIWRLSVLATNNAKDFDELIKQMEEANFIEIDETGNWIVSENIFVKQGGKDLVGAV